MKRNKRIILVVFIIISILILIGLISTFFLKVLLPAHQSYLYDCTEQVEFCGEKLVPLAQIKINGTGTEIILSERASDKELRHETVHLNQYYSGRIYTCQNIIMRHVNEMEAYLMSYLPDFIFKRIYSLSAEPISL